MRLKVLVIIAVLIANYANAQHSAAPANPNVAASKGSVQGRILDAISGSPMEYANVVLYSKKDSSIVTGTVTNVEGRYTLNDVSYGHYFMKIKFLGYEEYQMNSVKVRPDNPNLVIEDIKLNPDNNNLNEVEVSADRTEVLFKLDKKVVTVGSNLSTAGGSAVDALENTPSVSVDIEGNVSLRGSSNFTVLIDGKPSPFEGSDALEMIPASTIDKIEIITNPSAKYDPEGTAGIINVITKHSALEGLSGVVNITSDTQGSFGGDVLLNYNFGKVNLYAGLNYDERVRNGYVSRETVVSLNDEDYYTFSDGDRNGGHSSQGLRLGMDYSPSKSSTFTAVFSLGKRDNERIADSYYWETNTLTEDTLFSNSYASNLRWNQNAKLDLDFTHKFDTEGHQIKAALSTSYGQGDEDNMTDQYEDKVNNFLSSVKSTEGGDDLDFRLNVDYELPLSKSMKFESGLQSTLEFQEETYTLDIENAILDTVFNNALTSNYQRSIQALYAMFNHEIGKFGYQLGLRGEYTYRLLQNLESGEDFSIDRFDLFPSAHISYQLPADQQLQASFSRRIQRPRNYFLEPFQTYRDIYTIWQGNPAILPEYTNSYELSYQKKVGTGFVSADLFHRINYNKMERVQTIYDENTVLMTMDNVGTDYSTGGELMFNLNPYKWWNINLTGSAFHYEIDSELFNTNNESFNWEARARTTFRLGKSVRFQLDGFYNSPSVSAQGRREGFYMFGSSLRMNFLDNRLSATLQIRDIFNTARHEFISEMDDYYSRVLFQRNGQVVQLSVSYKINNYKEKKSKSGSGDFEGGDMDM